MTLRFIWTHSITHCFEWLKRKENVFFFSTKLQVYLSIIWLKHTHLRKKKEKKFNNNSRLFWMTFFICSFFFLTQPNFFKPHVFLKISEFEMTLALFVTIFVLFLKYSFSFLSTFVCRQYDDIARFFYFAYEIHEEMLHFVSLNTRF